MYNYIQRNYIVSTTRNSREENKLISHEAKEQLKDKMKLIKIYIYNTLCCIL